MPALPDPQHEHFCQIYAVTRHGKKAAREAGLPPVFIKNPSPFIQRPYIAARIREILGIAMANADITPERVLRELSRVAFADVRDLYDEDGELLPVHELDDDTAATIAGIDVEVHKEGRGEEATLSTIRKYRRVDKMVALGLLAKHFKIVGDEGDGVNALASALADRLNSAKRRMNEGDVEDAVIRPRGAIEHQPAEPLDWPTPPPAAEPAPARAATAPAVPPPAAIIPTPSEENDDELW